MLIGIPKEIKVHEYRVGLLPTAVHELTARGHQVLVERDAAAGIGCSNDEYEAAGAAIAQSADEVFAKADMIVKVKEPQPIEYGMLRDGQVLFTYLHLASDPQQTRGLAASGSICIAYETVTSPRGDLPLLAPMSEVAGRMAIQVGAHALEKNQGGGGILLGGVPGVPPARVVLIGGGVVGANAALIASGMGADVTVLDKNIDVLRRLAERFGNTVRGVCSNATIIGEYVAGADLVVGAVLVPGAEAPKLITRDMIKAMRPGSALVDVAIDQGGISETSRPTTHAAPTYIEEGVVHYCVTNIPGAVARTSSYTLSDATLPFVIAIADKGWRRALGDDEHLKAGLNVAAGRVTYKPVADSTGQSFTEPDELLGFSG